MQVIECVPNFSEGRNLSAINEIAGAISAVEGAYLLHKDIGYAVNRTVMTIAGAPEAVAKAAFNAIDYASRLIDMRKHMGEHPRIGATDVCPIIPLANINMADCVNLSLQLAERVSTELKIPVYLYGESAKFPERKNLAYLRKGQYENLSQRITGSNFKPDFGPAQFNARSGATVIGARKILIAFNLSLNTNDAKVAKWIAAEIRRLRKIELSQPGSISFWRNCQAFGWFIKEYNCCQITMNLLDYQKTPLAAVLKSVNALAIKFGTKVTGGEIIGLVPLPALLEAGRAAVKQTGATDKVSEQDLIDAAVQLLNLNQRQTFIASEKVLEYKLAEYGLV